MRASLAKYFLYYPALLLRGEPVLRHLASYEASQWWRPEELKRYQEQRLERLLAHAITHCAHYARTLTTSDANAFASQPFLTKQLLRDQKAALISAAKPAFLHEKTTGGSTGQAVTLVKTREALARERAATWRAYRWAGVDIGDPQGRFWGVPFARKDRLRHRLIDLVNNRVRLSAFDFNEAALERYFVRLCRFKPKYLYGYVSVLSAFAQWLDASGKRLPFPLASVIATSEVLAPPVRALLARVFETRVFNEYGCGEVGSIAHECEAGQLHLMAENLLVETLVDDRPARTGERAEIVVTELNNQAMPLVRYRLADFTEGPPRTGCACGRGLPFISGIAGRAYDMVKLPDGRAFHGEFFLYIFENLKREGRRLNQFQVVHEAPTRIKVLLVAAPEEIAQATVGLRTAIHAGMGSEIEVLVERVSDIARQPSGKLLLVKGLAGS